MNRQCVAGVLLFLSLASLGYGAEHVSVVLKPGSQLEDLARAIQGRGRIASRDPFSGAYWVRPVGVSAYNLAASLGSKPLVASARTGRPHLRLEDVDMLNAESVRQALEEMQGRNRDREAMAKVRGLPPLEKTEKIKTGYLEAWLFWLAERAYPYKTLDVAAYDVAVRHRDQMPPAFGASPDGLGATSWQYVGPRNLDIPYRTYYGLRPIIGRVGAIAVDPSNPNIVYMGGANGGVWKSTDAGVNWTPLTDSWTYIAVSSLAIDPSNPSILYAGTGDFHGSRPFQMGIMKSTNGGQTWAQVGSAQFGTRAVSAILIDPENPSLLVATTGRGSGGAGFVWRSIDGGLSWSNVLNTAANWCGGSIGAMDGQGQRAYYVSGSGTGGNVWKSMDRGLSWTKLTIPASAGSHSVISVAASPNFPGTVYIVVNADRKVFKSTDYGVTWTDITAGFPNGNNNYFWSQSTYNFYLACSTAPGPQDVLYVGMIDCVQSPDGGATWRSIGGPTYASNSVLHNDQQAICVNLATPNSVYIGNDGGAYRYDYNPSTGTGTWAYLNANLGISMFYKMDVHPTNPTWVIGGTQDNATPVAVGDLANWENCGGGDGGFGAIHPTNPNIQYAEAQNLAMYRTGNAWVTQSSIAPSYGNDRVAFIAPFTLDPNNPNLLYAGTNYVYRRNDATGVWENRLGGQSLSGTGTIRYIAVAPGDGNRIYTVASDGQVWMTSNAGVTWTQINTGTPSLPNRTFNYIAVNPANKNDILVTCSGTGTGHLWRCPDTTAPSRTWIDLSGSGPTGLPNIGANAVQRDAFDFENVFYVGTDVGAFVTEDGGATWANLTAPFGLPNVQVNDFRIQASNTLFAATYGRGIWKLALPPIVYPATVAILSGSHLGGGLNELRNSDDQRYSVLGDDAVPIVEVEFRGTAPAESATELHFFFEGSTARPGLSQDLSFFNFSTNAWDGMDHRLSSTTDVRFIKKLIGNAAPYIHPTTREIRAKVRWVPSSDENWPSDGWAHRIDRAVWRVVP